jgi:hypothetical protein
MLEWNCRFFVRDFRFGRSAAFLMGRIKLLLVEG